MAERVCGCRGGPARRGDDPAYAYLREGQDAVGRRGANLLAVAAQHVGVGGSPGQGALDGGGVVEVAPKSVELR